MQRQGLIGLVATLFLLLFWLGWTPATPAARKPRVAAEVSATPAGPSGDQRALLLMTPTPLLLAEGPRVRLDVHVEANAQGEGSAHVVASSQGGQALAHIDTKGQASGQALADAPALPGCTVCGDAGPLESGGQEQGAGGREQGARGQEQGAGGREQGARGQEQGARGQEQGARGQEQGAEATPASGQAVILVDANLRSGPDLGSVVIGGAHAGDRYAVTGRSPDQTWWRICCTPDSRAAWVYGPLAEWVDPALPLSSLVTASIPLPAFVTPVMVATPVTPTATATPALAFAILEQEQHSEANAAVLYAWVQDGHGVSLEGYRLQVLRNGSPLSIGAVRSTAYRQGTTRPSDPGGPEDKPYNLKLAFDRAVMGEGFAPAGGWAVQLLDPQNQPAAPLALFALRPNDDHMEMYLSYGRR